MRSAVFATATNFFHTISNRTEAFGRTFREALPNFSKSALTMTTRGVTWLLNMCKKPLCGCRPHGWYGSWLHGSWLHGCLHGVHPLKFCFVGLDSACSLHGFNGSTQGTFDEPSVIGGSSSTSHRNFTGIANLVRSVGATCNSVHVVRLAKADRALVHFSQRVWVCGGEWTKWFQL